MADKDDGLVDEVAPKAQDDSPDDVVDLEAALERRDTEITQLKEALLTEQRLANHLRQKIKKIDTKIGDLGDGLVDRLGTTRDLQSVLADQRTVEQESNQELGEHDFTELQAQSEERMAVLRSYQKNLDELACQRDRVADQLAEIDRLAKDPDRRERLQSGRPDPRPELNSLEELMAETVVMTDEERESLDFDLDDTAIQKQAAGKLVDMLSPEAMVPLAERANPANDGRYGTLIVTLQGGHKLRFPVFDRDITIGRSATSDIQINSEFVSRHHARVAIGEAGLIIEDVSSMNGIIVDSKNVKRHIFKSGDVVVLGTTRLTFQTDNSTEGG